MSVESESASYDPIAWAYNCLWSRHTEWMMSAVRELVLRDHPPPARMLDLCCGTGQLDRILQETGYDVTGVDGSPEMIHFAREDAPACRFFLSDVRNFSAAARFDLALCLYDSLNHLMAAEDVRRAFRAIHGALRGGAPLHPNFRPLRAVSALGRLRPAPASPTARRPHRMGRPR